jgi:trimeric autotransporter adhesin
MDGNVYFAATAADGTARELWKSNGTEAGTVMVKDIKPGASSSPSYITNVNGTLYFAANDGVHGTELWKSDGTEAGTVMVKDINPSGGSFPEDLTNVNGALYFTADDGVHGPELWVCKTTLPFLPLLLLE